MSESENDLEQRIAGLERQADELRAALTQRPRPIASRRDWSTYSAVIASLVGLLALAISAYTAYVQREQLRAQTWPIIKISTSDVQPRYFLENLGTGPARITGARVTVDGRVVHDRKELVRTAGVPYNLVWSSLATAVLASGNELKFLAPREGDDDSRRTFLSLLWPKVRIDISLCYCSVLDDCWVTGYSLPTAPSDNCPIPDGERFTD